MRIFFHEDTNKLIFTPLRNGSSLLLHNVDNFKLTFLNCGYIKRDKELFKELQKQSDINKIFIYRDPIKRLFSFYYKFVFTNTYAKTEFPKFLPTTSSKSFIDNLYNSLPKIEMYHKDDSHTLPQYLGLELINEDINTHEVISLEDYEKWLFLQFAFKNKEPFVSSYKFNFDTNINSIMQLMEIRERISRMYEKDFNTIGQLVTRL